MQQEGAGEGRGQMFTGQTQAKEEEEESQGRDGYEGGAVVIPSEILIIVIVISLAFVTTLSKVH